MLTQPLAALVAEGQIDAGGRVMVELAESGDDADAAVRRRQTPPRDVGLALRTVLVLDDNQQLLKWLGRELDAGGLSTLVASSAAEARDLAARQPIDLAIVDLLLPDGDGLSVAFELLRLWPRLRVVVMTGGELSAEEIELCERQEFPVLRKPFLAMDLLSLVQASLLRVQRRRPIDIASAARSEGRHSRARSESAVPRCANPRANACSSRTGGSRPHLESRLSKWLAHLVRYCTAVRSQ